MLGQDVVADEFVRITGLAVQVQNPAGGVIEITPKAHEQKNSFVIRAAQRQHKLTIEFEPGTFVAPLVHAMGEVDNDGRSLWQSQVEDLASLSCSIVISVNNSPVDAAMPAAWPRAWRFLRISLARNLVALDAGDLEDGLRPASYWIARFAALLPLEAAPVEQFEPDIEGDPRLVQHTRYERSPRNRQAAIAIHGFECRRCTTNMEYVYGELGREFIHVHHLTPLSELDKPVPADPAKDLIPLCPNCHAIVHRRRPPYTLEDLRKALGRG